MADNIVKKIFSSGERAKVWRVFIFIILLIIAGFLVDFGAYYNKANDWLTNQTSQFIKLPKVKELPFRLGLDLLGGTYLVYQADVSAVSIKDRQSAVEGVRDVIERRVNVFGVSEPVVQTNRSGGEYRVIVELAGIKDVSEAIKMIGETPLLEFKEQGAEIRELTPEEITQLEEFNNQAEERVEEVLGKVLSGGDFNALAKEYSQDESAPENRGDLGWVTEISHPELVGIAKGLEVGENTDEFIKISQGYEIIKLEDKQIKINPFTDQVEKEVKASHLLICHNEVEGCEDGLSKDEALAEINDLKGKATLENFSNLVRENSTEPGAADRGGELGWFSRGMMIEPFEEAVFTQATGTISEAVETSFGYHLIYKKEEQDIEEYKISHILIKTKTQEDIVGKPEDWQNTELTGKNLKRASVQFDPNDNSPEVALLFDNEGAKMFEEITARNVSKPVAIFLDNYPISIPTVNEKITGGKAVITGSFNAKEAKLLAQRLNAGALPVPIDLIKQQTIGASLGEQSVIDSLNAGIIGLILVALFMIIVYRLPGLLAVFSLAIYGILVLAVCKLWPVTLSLAGLAGFVLSVGMAVDANVLIFERFKEELAKGKPIDVAREEGFKRAWPSIRDGNVSTLITCFILIQFTTSVVKGFAITLSLGIIISMFSAIVITRTFLRLVSGEWLEKRKRLLGVKLR